ncbi:MAG: outer membrane lipoprotein LolB [Proteobacteria bacterium]|nr:outer membrane lipoprotein LolB [Pseudomonadota bacterium]
MRSSPARACAALAVLLGVAGCHTLPLAPVASAPWDVRRAMLQAQGHFAVKGRVAVATGSTGFNANLRWSQVADDAHVTIEGPLGIGAVQVNASGTALEVINAKSEHISDEMARAELRTRLGFDAPIGSLRYWILGVPRPGSEAQETLDAAQQRLSDLDQDGWHVAYGSYTQVNGQALPARLTLEHESVRVRLVVDDWQL